MSLDAKTIFEVKLGLRGRSYFPLFLPSPDSPLRWRELLVFSAASFLSRRAGAISRVRLESKTLLTRHSIARIVEKLQTLSLLGGDLCPIEPQEPGRFFGMKRRTPVFNRWTDKLVYTRYYIPATRARNDGHGLEPFDSCLLGFLSFKQPSSSSVAYLAASTGIDRKQVRSSLERLATLGFVKYRRDESDLVLSYRYPDRAILFRKARIGKSKTASSLEGVPAFLVQLHREEHIPLSYVVPLAGIVDQLLHLYPADWLEIIRECSSKHQSFRAKTGVPYPSPKMILSELNKRNRNRARYG